MNDSKHKELPFGIEFVVSEDLAKLPSYNPRKACGNSFDIDCPFCNGKRKMNINTAKNLAKCNKCGGGKGYNAISLHAALTGISNKESYADLMKRWNGLKSDVKLAFKSKEAVPEGLVPADIVTRDKVYRRLLGSLSLSSKHEQDLLNRGLSKEQIAQGLYKTVPYAGFHSLAYDAVYASGAIKEIEKHKSWGIPGFADINDPGKISLKGRKRGYFIPVKTLEGYISGMQIRYDSLPDSATDKEREAYKKYTWYSSSEDKAGCSITGCENVHFAGIWSRVPETVNLTEGVLKADIASALSGKPFLGLVGVNNIGQLGKTLLGLSLMGAKHINLYIDMDRRSKPEVEAAMVNIKKVINSACPLTICPDEGNETTFNVSMCSSGTSDFVVSFDKPMPKEVLLFTEKKQIPPSMYTVCEGSIRLNSEYISVLRNTHHVLRIIDASDGFAEFTELGTAEKGQLLKSRIIKKAGFTKEGLTYTEMEWDERYNGIDDFYYYMQEEANRSNL